jgi:hypothetical protein
LLDGHTVDFNDGSGRGVAVIEQQIKLCQRVNSLSLATCQPISALKYS